MVPDGSAGFIVRPGQRLVACVVDIVVAGLGILGWGWINDPRLSSGEASIVAIFEYSVFLFGSVFALMLFGQTVDFWQGVGFALIILGGVIIVLRSGREIA